MLDLDSVNLIVFVKSGQLEETVEILILFVEDHLIAELTIQQLLVVVL